MNLWDSVHRGLEKASHEAARLARTQRLRATLDGMTRQVNTLHTVLINRTMDLYISGQLAQSELLPMCQELANLQQQMQQIQAELKQLQASQPQAQVQGPGTGPQAAGTELYPLADEGATYAPPPPDYQPYGDGGPITAPPPSGAEGLTVSGMETVLAPPPPDAIPAQQPVTGGVPRFCPACHAELNPGHAFCHNCGTMVQDPSSLYQPTMRGSAAEETAGSSDIETLRAAPFASQQQYVAPPSTANPNEDNKGV